MAEWRTETVENCLVQLRLGAIKKVQTQDYSSSGRYPIIDQGQALIAGWTDDVNGLIDHDLPVVVFGDHTRTFKFIDFPFVRGADGTQVLKPKPSIDPLYFYYALRGINLPSRGYNRHFKALKEKEISIPRDRNEQEEIARILRTIDYKIDLNRKERDVLNDLFKTLLRMLMTGEIRVADLDLSALVSKPKGEVVA